MKAKVGGTPDRGAEMPNVPVSAADADADAWTRVVLDRRLARGRVRAARGGDGRFKREGTK